MVNQLEAIVKVFLTRNFSIVVSLQALTQNWIMWSY